MLEVFDLVDIILFICKKWRIINVIMRKLQNKMVSACINNAFRIIGIKVDVLLFSINTPFMF